MAAATSPSTNTSFDVERKVNTTANSVDSSPAAGPGPDTSTNLSRGVRRVDEAVNTVKDTVQGRGSDNDTSNAAREGASQYFDVGKRNDIGAEASTTDKKATRGTYTSSSSDHRPQGDVDQSEGGISQRLQGVFGAGR
jgi:hypothetical protein